MKLLNLNSSSTVTDGVYQLQPFGESLTKIDCATWKSLKFRLALSKCVQKCMFVTYFDYKLHADGYLTSKEKIQTLAYFFWSLSGFWSWIVHKFTEIGLCGDRKSPLSIPLFFAPEKFIFSWRSRLLCEVWAPSYLCYVRKPSNCRQKKIDYKLMNWDVSFRRKYRS